MRVDLQVPWISRRQGPSLPDCFDGQCSSDSLVELDIHHHRVDLNRYRVVVFKAQEAHQLMPLPDWLSRKSLRILNPSRQYRRRCAAFEDVVHSLFHPYEIGAHLAVFCGEGYLPEQ
jgi:hypothetical protein